MNKIIGFLIYVIGFVAINTSLYSQGVTTASISGTVFDEKNESLPGAIITVIHEPSGTKYLTSSRSNGQFTVANVRTGGPYTISTSFVGFEKYVIRDIFLALGEESDFTINLKLSGTIINEVEVTGKQDPIFNVDHNGASTNISNDEIKSIPSINRSLSDMTRITPQGSSQSNFAGRNSLYNNLSINGSLFNNVFGLAGSLGGQTNSQPISIDAIQEIQVSLSPYDVRQSGFTGAGINAITKSGTNDFSGSVYRYQRNQNFVGKKVEGNSVKMNNFDFYQQGFRLGGPIIENKLFFFVNAEMERRSEPSHTYQAARPGLTGGNVTTVAASTLDSLRNFLIQKYDYDPGNYENITQKTLSDKILIRLDYNINQNHKINISYNYLKSWRNNIAPSSRAANKTELWFSNNGYKINNNINSVIAELNSNFSNKASNTLVAGFSAFRDFREMPGQPFPMVEISRNGSVMTTFGTEQYTPNNRLNTNVIQVSDNVTLYVRSHTIMFGGSLENYRFENGFTPQYYGDFQYNSLADFYTDARDGAMKPATSSSYTLNYSAIAGGGVPVAKLNVTQIGVYGQDEVKINKNLKVTLGFRADIPSYPINLPKNAVLDTSKFINSDGNQTKIDVSQLPEVKILWSPRVGFNWDVFGNKNTQIRGGIGIFTGRIPFVWISNQASNNGVLFGQINLAKGYPFTPDVNKYVPATVSYPKSFAINSTDPNFKFPQVMRANIAVDQKLIAGIVGSVEGMLTRDINAVYIANYNLPMPVTVAADGRSIYPLNNKLNSYITNAFIIKNTNQGYSYFLTAQLQKSFKFNHYGLDLMTSYTYSETKDINSGGSATAANLFIFTPVKNNPNKPNLSWSDWDQPQKLVGMINMHTEYLKFFGTAVSIIYTGLQSGRFSYTYTGSGSKADFNNDGVRGNDLIYVPNGNDINLVSKDDRSVAQVWDDLNTYINQDSYLKHHKGQIMDRNGAVYPWLSQFDIKLTQDFFINVSGKRNTLEFTMDIINAGNMLNSGWGVRKSVNRTSLLNYEGLDASGKAQFSFPYFDATNKVPLTNTFSSNYGLTSLYQFQLGIRYIFN